MPSLTTLPLWRRAFLRALGQGANVRMAARHAGIGTRQPYTHRAKDPLFATLWAQAEERGREALAAQKSPRPGECRTAHFDYPAVAHRPDEACSGGRRAME